MRYILLTTYITLTALQSHAFNPFDNCEAEFSESSVIALLSRKYKKQTRQDTSNYTASVDFLKQHGICWVHGDGRLNNKPEQIFIIFSRDNKKGCFLLTENPKHFRPYINPDVLSIFVKQSVCGVADFLRNKPAPKTTTQIVGHPNFPSQNSEQGFVQSSS